MSNLVSKGSKYSDEDRRTVVVEYSVLGNVKMVAQITGIPRTTINDWRKSDWWDEVSVMVRPEIQDRILNQNLQIATKAGERVLDSLEHGDEKLVWDKATGEHVIKRVKPAGKDAAVIGGIAQDKARLQMNLPTKITSNTNDMLALARQFQEITRTLRNERVVAVQEDSEEID